MGSQKKKKQYETMNQVRKRKSRLKSRSKSRPRSHNLSVRDGKRRSRRKVRTTIGKKIQVRDADDEEWRVATVTSKDPLMARLEGCGKAYEWSQIKKFEKRSKSRLLSANNSNSETSQ